MPVNVETYPRTVVQRAMKVQEVICEPKYPIALAQVSWAGHKLLGHFYWVLPK